MELFLALLTGVLTGLLVGHFNRIGRRRVRERAGKLLCRVRLQRPTMAQMFCVLFATILMGIMVHMFVKGRVYTYYAPFILGWLGLLITLIVAFGLASTRDLEIWEYGCLLPRSFCLLTWHRMRYVKWMKPRGRICFMGRLVRSTLSIDVAQMAAVTKILFSRVELLDQEGDVMNPEMEYAYERSLLPKGGQFPFQFDLRSLMLLVVVAAVASSWAGVHVQAQRREEAVLRYLEPFDPVVRRRGDRVYKLDFSNSTTKPTDEAMSRIAELRYLEVLDLTESPVTDAGLVHLENLKNLRCLTITHNRATDEGLVRLANIKSLRVLHILWMRAGKVVDAEPFSTEACNELHSLRPDLVIF